MKTLRVGLIGIALMLLPGAPMLAQTGHDLFQQALVLEQAEGNLGAAIQLYERIADEFAGDRELVAKALVQMGRCYEKLGLTDARQVYRRVIDDFPEQQSEVAIARERLASLAQELAELRRGPTFRKIEIASKPQNGVLSPDGSKLAFVADGVVWAVPLEGNVDPNIAGEPVRLAEVPGAYDFGNNFAWSANGEWIAVNGDDIENTAYLVSVGTGNPRMISLLARSGPLGYRMSLSPDGQRLAYTAYDKTEEYSWYNGHVYVVPIQDGEPLRVSSSWGSGAAFSPDGEFIAYVGFRERDDLPEGAQPWSGDLWVVRSTGGVPVKLTDVDGILSSPVWSPDGRFIAVKGEGNYGRIDGIWVYPLSADASSAGEPTEIVLPKRPVGRLAGWTPQNELGVFMETEYHSAIYTVPAPGGRATQVTPEGHPYYPRWSPDGERIFLRWMRVGADKGPTGVRVAYVPAEGGAVVEVPWPGQPLMSVVPGGGHNVSPDGEQIVIAAAEPALTSVHGGDLWTMPVDGGPLTRLTNDESQERYPCWSPDGQTIAFTDDSNEESEDGGFTAIFVVSTTGGEPRQLTSEADSVGDGAIAFSPDGERIAFFSGDAIKTVPVQGGQPEVLVADVTSGMHSHLEWSPDGSKIAHNVLELSPAGVSGTIWITPLDGGAPEELRTGLPQGARLSDFGWSPDGERIVFLAEFGGDFEFWLVSDFLPQ
jgi:Tol biopolymer transport system component